MTEDVQTAMFTIYQGYDIDDTMAAAQLTKDNLKALQELTGAVPTEFVDEEERPVDDKQALLWLPNDPSGEHLAIEGDYIMQDLAGHYLTIPKATFEKRYAKRV